jgi:hypothetical protein
VLILPPQVRGPLTIIHPGVCPGPWAIVHHQVMTVPTPIKMQKIHPKIGRTDSYSRVANDLLKTGGVYRLHTGCQLCLCYALFAMHFCHSKSFRRQKTKNSLTMISTMRVHSKLARHLERFQTFEIVYKRDRNYIIKISIE